MSWDPRTAIILHQPTAIVLYQPIDFHAIATKEVSKSIAAIKAEAETAAFAAFVAVDALGPQEAYPWVSATPAATIQKLREIQSSIQRLEEDLKRVTKGFEEALELEINSVNTAIARAKSIIESHLLTHDIEAVAKEELTTISAQAAVYEEKLTTISQLLELKHKTNLSLSTEKFINKLINQDYFNSEFTHLDEFQIMSSKNHEIGMRDRDS